jgi:hypothetical protein
MRVNDLETCKKTFLFHFKLNKCLMYLNKCVDVIHCTEVTEVDSKQWNNSGKAHTINLLIL